MNFKGWNIEVNFVNIDFDNSIDQKLAKLSMEATITYLINDCEFMPRKEDLIHEMEKPGEPFVVEQIEINPKVRLIEFFLTLEEEEE